MYPAPSAGFLAALSQSHRLVTVVELHRTDGSVVELEHLGGSVTVDRGQAVRRTCTVTVSDTSLIPMTPSESMLIYGARLRILAGIRYPTGETETVPLGLFRVDAVDGDPDIGPVQIQGKDLSAIVTDDKFTTPYTTRGATAAVASITGIIQRSIPTAVVTSTATDATLGVRTWDVEADPWAAVQELAAAIGAEVYVDPDGVFRVAELPDLLTAPVAWEVDAGPDGALVSASRAHSRDDMYNYVLATGENTEENVPPVSAYAADEDPSSPTYVSGPFGRVSFFYSSPTLTTTVLAQNAATKLLRDAIKPNATADISSLPNPLLEPGDVVRVTYGSGERELHQIQGFTVDLSPEGGAFTLSTIGGKEDA